MFLRILFAILFCFYFFPEVAAFAEGILVVQGLRAAPFDDSLRGFKSVCGVNSKTVFLSDAKELNLRRIVRDEKPSLILAIGAEPLRRAIRIQNTPIIYLMVLNPEKITGKAENISGVSMDVSAEKYLDLIKKLKLPQPKVGMLYDPTKSGSMVKKIVQKARSMGIEISAKEIRRAQEAPEAISRLSDSINLFWMLPDSTVITAETVELILLLTQQKRIPVLAFSGKYVDMGALLSLDIDSFDMGKQAGEMANRVLRGERINEIPPADPRKAIIKINQKVAAKLGLNLNSIDTTFHSSSNQTSRLDIQQKD